MPPGYAEVGPAPQVRARAVGRPRSTRAPRAMGVRGPAARWRRGGKSRRMHPGCPPRRLRRAPCVPRMPPAPSAEGTRGVPDALCMGRRGHPRDPGCPVLRQRRAPAGPRMPFAACAEGIRGAARRRGRLPGRDPPHCAAVWVRLALRRSSAARLGHTGLRGARRRSLSPPAWARLCRRPDATQALQVTQACGPALSRARQHGLRLHRPPERLDHQARGAEALNQLHVRARFIHGHRPHIDHPDSGLLIARVEAM